MAQVTTGQLISLELLPLQLPEAAPVSAITFSRETLIPQTLETKLNLQPGDLSELVVRIKNHSDAPVRLNFSVTGNVPPDWWQLRTEGSTLPGQYQMEAVVYFAIAADFFEQPLSPDQLPLQLNYTGQLTVTAITDSGHSQQQMQSFQVLVRPPSLYLDFLPDIYRSVDFVGRFLKIFETTFEPTVDILDHQWAYLDPLTAPQSILPFLAHWVGWEFQGPLSLAQQRALIRYAMEIYRWRGTRRGLRFYLHLASGLPLDDHVDSESQRSIGIHENFSQGHILGQTIMGESTILSGNIPYHFSVRLRPPADYPLDETLIRTIIEQEKPAFCSYDLAINPRTDTV